MQLLLSVLFIFSFASIAEDSTTQLQAKSLLRGIFEKKENHPCEESCEKIKQICGDLIYQPLADYLAQTQDEIKANPINFKINENFKIINNSTQMPKAGNNRLSELLKKNIAELVKIDHLQGAKNKQMVSLIRYKDKLGKTCTLQVRCSLNGSHIDEIAIDPKNCVSF